jgi:hypothetical protein
MKQPGFRLTTRKMMILVLILGLGLGWVAHRARLQRDAVAAINKAGGYALYDWQYRDGERLADGTPGGPKWLAGILGPHYFDSVTYVYLSAQVTDADMAKVADLGRVERLILDVSGLSGAGLAELDRMTSLESLVINSGAVGVDARIMPLRAISRLRELVLAGTDVSDAGLELLPTDDRLEWLDLEKTKITDAGLVRLGEMQGLRHLSVENTRIGDEGLSQLRRLTKLRRLSVNRTDTTAAGVDAFRKALPTVKVRDQN